MIASIVAASGVAASLVCWRRRASAACIAKCAWTAGATARAAGYAGDVMNGGGWDRTTAALAADATRRRVCERRDWTGRRDRDGKRGCHGLNVRTGSAGGRAADAAADDRDWRAAGPRTRSPAPPREGRGFRALSLCLRGVPP